MISELAPKRIALQRAEGISLLVAPTLDRVARASRPVIWLLSKSTDVVVRLFGVDPAATRDAISEEELRDIVAAHETLGREERQLIEDVFEAGERQLHEVMVPRTEVDFLDASMPVYKAVKLSSSNPHSRYPVVRGSHDEVVGFVHVRDLFAPEVAGTSVRIGEIAREVKMMPGTKRVLSAMSEMRREGHHLAIVVDEYGGTDGIVTLEDLVEEIIGDIHDEYDVAEEPSRALVDGDLEVDGLLNLEDFEDRTGLELPEGPYETVAGFVINELGRLPELDESVSALGRRFTVTELDGRRIARVRLTPEPQPAEPRRRPTRPRTPPRPVPDPERPRTPQAPGRMGPCPTSPSRASCPACSRPPTRCTSATTSARCGSGSTCRTVRDVLLRRRPARDHRGARPRRCCGRGPGSTAAQYLAAGVDPERSDAVRAEPHRRAHPAAVGAGLPHRLRRGQPDDAVQGQVARAAAACRWGCSPTRSCRRPTSCSTGRSGCRSARTSASTSSSAATWRSGSTAGSATPSSCPSRTSWREVAKIYDLQSVEKQMSKSIGGNGVVWLLRRPEGRREEDQERGHRHRPRGPVRPGGQARREQPAGDPVGLRRRERRRTWRPGSPARATAT